MKYANMLEGRYALVLGGDTAVGSAVASLFSAAGAQVAVVHQPPSDVVGGAHATITEADVAVVDKPHGGTVMYANADKPHGGTVTNANVDKPHDGTVTSANADKPLGGTVMYANADKPHGGTVMNANADKPHGGTVMNRSLRATCDPDMPNILAFESQLRVSAMGGLCAAVLAKFPYVDILVSATAQYKTVASTDQYKTVASTDQYQTVAAADPYKTAATTDQYKTVASTDQYKTAASYQYSVQDFSVHELQLMLEVNFGCAVRCFQELLPGMLRRRRGEIVLFAPDLVDAGIPGAAAAAACAGAISSFARNVTFDYIRYRIRANTIQYPFVGTLGRKPLSGAPDAHDAANAALWSACYMSRFVTGEKLSVNGGLAYTTTTNAYEKGTATVAPH